VRPERRRTKKLILAFQFQFSDQAGWKCETCRAAGLEKRRRCGFLTEFEHGSERAIWARKQVVATNCPKSSITSESLSWIDDYCAWKLAGGMDYRTMSARQVDAFCVLERELTAERRDARD
jgi:hypothetical protein